MHPADILEIYRAKELRTLNPLGDTAVKDHYRVGSDQVYKIARIYPHPFNDDTLKDRQKVFECKICNHDSAAFGERKDRIPLFFSLRSMRAHLTTEHPSLVQSVVVRKIKHHYDLFL